MSFMTVTEFVSGIHSPEPNFVLNETIQLLALEQLPRLEFNEFARAYVAGEMDQSEAHQKMRANSWLGARKEILDWVGFHAGLAGTIRSQFRRFLELQMQLLRKCKSNEHPVMSLSDLVQDHEIDCKIGNTQVKGTIYLLHDPETNWQMVLDLNDYGTPLDPGIYHILGEKAGITIDAVAHLHDISPLDQEPSKELKRAVTRLTGAAMAREPTVELPREEE